MSAFARIYNTKFEPLTDVIEIADDTEFAALEAQAAELATGGTKCCIRCIRDSDGRVAYWGPAGASFNPHWYVNLGRPKAMQGGKGRNVYLDDASWARAVELGNGNASDGKGWR